MIKLNRLSRKKISLFTALFLLVSSIAQPTIARAMDVDFYSRNDILFYDPEACTVTNQAGSIAVIGNDNAEKIFKFLISTAFKGTGDKPFNAVQAAGALGNFHQESSMDPSAIESPSGEGHGLAQWSYDRKAKLFALAAAEGKEWSDIELQLKMISNELNDLDGSDEGTRLLATEFATVTDPVKASYIFQLSYERAGTPAQEKRDSAALANYERFKSLAPGDVSVGGKSTACAGGDDGAGTGGISDFMGANFKIYNQCQYPPYGGDWGTQTNSAGYTSCMVSCGPTSLAMAITNMTGKNVTPKDTNDYYDQANLWANAGYGSWRAGLDGGAEHWGLKTASFDTSDINAYKEVFSKGGLVILAGNGGAPFLPQGHYIVVRGITTEGKFLIGDPGMGESTNGTPEDPKKWDAVPIMLAASADGSAAIYK